MEEEEVLKACCWWAQEVENQNQFDKKYFKKRGNVIYFGKIPLAFKPGVSDKLLFNKLIKENFSFIRGERKGNAITTSSHIMSLQYWKKYGWYDEWELKNSR
jgi:hypothetical protein